MTETSKQLFDECVFAFVLSRDLSKTTANTLRESIENNGGQALKIVEGPIDLEAATHIISTTSDFPQYTEARLHMVPVVTPTWVSQSLLREKLALLRPHTPDPNLFFSNVNVSCEGLPTGDKDAIIGAVLAMGGMESNHLTKMVTHICALDLDGPKCKQALDKNLKCKIVLPHWFDDCLKLGKKIDERPYLLPNPEITRLKSDDPLPMPDTEHMRGADSPKPHSSMLSGLAEPLRELRVFQGKTIMISTDLEIRESMRTILELLIKRGGGNITTKIHKADIFVCHYRDGKDYVWAARNRLNVGNLSWLFYLITHNEWTSPLRRLLHYPLPRHGIPGFKNTRITLSNYGGEARTYLENLVVAAGGEFTKSMKQDNTHLITARKSSEKCTAALEWNINMINHLWLEESYARCEMQAMTDTRYTHFPPRTNLGEIIGETRFEEEILEQIYFPEDPEASPGHPRSGQRRVMTEKDKNTQSSAKSNDEDAAPEKIEKASKAVKARRTKSNPTAETVRTPVPSRRIVSGKENSTPSTTGSRSAKDAAKSRLDYLKDDVALYEKEKKRKGAVWGGERALHNLDKERSRERTLSSPVPGKRDADELSEDEGREIDTPNKRQKTAPVPKMAPAPKLDMRLLITKYEPWVGNLHKEDIDKKRLRALGISVVHDYQHCTHLAAPALVRTQKFLMAIPYAPVVLSTEFIDACTASKSKECPDPANFLLKDAANEKKLGHKLKDILRRAKINNRRLLPKTLVYSTPNIVNGPETYRPIVVANGGIFNVYQGKPVLKKMSAEEDIGPAEPVYLLTGFTKGEKELWNKFETMARESNSIPRIVTTEWLLDLALTQEDIWDEEFLARNQNENA